MSYYRSPYQEGIVEGVYGNETCGHLGKNNLARGNSKGKVPER